MIPEQLTNDRGEKVGERLLDGPLPEGSVVLVNGLTGTAYQKFFSDGKFHSTVTGNAYPESMIMRESRVFLVYVPEED